MAKQHGLGWTTLTVDGASDDEDISNDVTEFEFSTPRGVQDVTGVDVSAYERLLLLADFSIELSGVFNPSAGQAHTTFRTVSSSDASKTVVLGHGGVTLTNECVFTDYALERSDDGELTWEAPGQLCDGTTPTWGTV